METTTRQQSGRSRSSWLVFGVLLHALAGPAAAGYLGLRQTQLAHAFFPPVTGISRSGDIHFNSLVKWADDKTDTTADEDFDLFTVALHELGHSLGLRHSNQEGSIMEPRYPGARRELSKDDINCIREIYGPEPAGFCLATDPDTGAGIISGRQWNPAEVSFSVMPPGSFTEDQGDTLNFFDLIAGALPNEFDIVLAAFAVWDAAANISSLGTVADDGSPFDFFPPDPRAKEGPFGDIRLANVPIPAPSSWLLLAAGLLGVGLQRIGKPSS